MTFQHKRQQPLNRFGDSVTRFGVIMKVAAKTGPHKAYPAAFMNVYEVLY